MTAVFQKRLCLALIVFIPEEERKQKAKANRGAKPPLGWTAKDRPGEAMQREESSATHEQSPPDKRGLPHTY